MKFNDYPLKDELGKGLHQYERNTGRSAHLLVESLIEKYLIKNGILGSDEDEVVEFPFDLIPTEEDVIPVNKNNFKKISHGAYYMVNYEELNFGHHFKEDSDELIEELAKLPYSRLVKLSKNTVGNLPQYPSFLRKSLNNPSYTPNEHEECCRNGKITVSPTKNGKYQIRQKNFSFGTFENEEWADEVASCLLEQDNSTIFDLKEKIIEFKGKRKECTLDFVRKYKESQ